MPKPSVSRMARTRIWTSMNSMPVPTEAKGLRIASGWRRLEAWAFPSAKFGVSKSGRTDITSCNAPCPPDRP